MPEILTGNPTNVLTPFVATITALLNNGAGACRVLTSLFHEFGDGDTVLITGTTQANLDNKYWTIAVIDATHFDLVGSTFATTHTGTATDVSLLPAIQCPLDGEGATMNTLLPVIKALTDRTQFLQAKAAIGTLRLVGAATAGISVGAGWGTVSSLYVVALASSPGPVLQALISGGTSPGDGQGPLSNVQAGDIVQVTATYTMNYNTTSLVHAFTRLEYQENCTNTAVGVSTAFDHGEQISLYTGAPTNATTSVTVSRVVGTGGPFAVFLNGLVDSATGTNSDWKPVQGSLTYQVWRPNAA